MKDKNAQNAHLIDFTPQNEEVFLAAKLHLMLQLSHVNAYSLS